MAYRIEQIVARQILDSRGNPTIEVTVSTKTKKGIATAPSGASTGTYEAVELRDGSGPYHGKGIQNALDNINTIITPALKGMDVREQEIIDKKLISIDTTKTKKVLGGNTCIAVSLATFKCAAACQQKELYEYLHETASIVPIPFMNVINGGLHAGNNLAIQEHMIAPVGSQSFSHAVQLCCEIYYTLKDILTKKFGKTAINVGDEGGFAPPLRSTEEALDIIMQAIEENGNASEVKLALDAAASSFYKDNVYILNKRMTGDELVDYYTDLCRAYPIISIEDGFDEEDWSSFTSLTQKIGCDVQIVGDDLFVTNAKRLRKGVKQGACNALLLKPNQIGTLTETLEVAYLSLENDYGVMVSHRSGDTCESFIADLAVGLETGQIKSGAPARGERVAKYNRLLEIEQLLEKPIYAGNNWNKKGL